MLFEATCPIGSFDYREQLSQTNFTESVIPNAKLVGIHLENGKSRYPATVTTKSTSKPMFMSSISMPV